MAVVPLGGTAKDFTPITDSVNWTTMAVGGFGSCSFAVPFENGKALRDIPFLARVVLMHGSRILWEGRIEDHDIDILGGTVTFRCFGYYRLLEDTTLRRIWILRSVPWQFVNALTGRPGRSFNPSVWAWSTVGRIDETDPTKSGLLFSAQTNQPVPAAGAAHGAFFYIDNAGITALYYKTRKIGNDPISGDIYDSPDGVTWTQRSNFTYAGALVVTNRDVTAVNQSAKYFCATTYFNSPVNGANVAGELYDFRYLGTQDLEDTTGGLYPRSILLDLLAQVAGLTVGTIDNDTSFAIPGLSRLSRDSARSVLDEVTSYYQRKWGVWENRVFDWKALDYEEPQWSLDVADMTALSITRSVDNTHKTVYISYSNLGTGFQQEASATSTDRRNPVVAAGITKDELLSSPVGLTSVSGAQLASRISADHGRLPAVRGSCSLPSAKLVESLKGSAMPASYIRAGDNVVIPALPKQSIETGRDGETIFHVTATETDGESGTTTLELDGYTRTSDILLARVASATRTLTG